MHRREEPRHTFPRGLLLSAEPDNCCKGTQSYDTWRHCLKEENREYVLVKNKLALGTFHHQCDDGKDANMYDFNNVNNKSRTTQALRHGIEEESWREYLTCTHKPK